MTIPTGVYRGSFAKGKMEGRGVFEWKDGSHYEGDYYNNKKHGRGKYLTPEGKAFEG